MVVVDTSAWIEWLVDSPTGPLLKPVFPARSECLVPTMVQLELSKWMTRECGEDKTDQVIAYTETCGVIPLDTRIALLAADFHRQYRLAAADAVVYATARAAVASLLTCDAHFEGLPGVIYVGKGR